jgi:hypothetical protein
MPQGVVVFTPAASGPNGCRNILIERRVDHQRTRHIVLMWVGPGLDVHRADEVSVMTGWHEERTPR